MVLESSRKCREMGGSVKGSCRDTLRPMEQEAPMGKPELSLDLEFWGPRGQCQETELQPGRAG